MSWSCWALQKLLVFSFQHPFWSLRSPYGTKPTNGLFLCQIIWPYPWILNKTILLHSQLIWLIGGFCWSGNLHILGGSKICFRKKTNYTLRERFLLKMADSSLSIFNYAFVVLAGLPTFNMYFTNFHCLIGFPMRINWCKPLILLRAGETVLWFTLYFPCF